MLCEAHVRAALRPVTMLLLEGTLFGIGAAVFTFLWVTYARAKKIPAWVWGMPQTVVDEQHPGKSNTPGSHSSAVLTPPPAPLARGDLICSTLLYVYNARHRIE